MMSHHFNAARFGRLWRAHWAESWRTYAWFVGVTAMVDVVFIGIFLSTESRSALRAFQFDGQIGWFACGLFGSGIIFAGQYFRQLASPGAALTALMRPASVFEKWLLALVYVSLLFPLAYTLGYSLLNYPVVQLAKAMHLSATLCATCTSSDADFSFYIPLITTDAHAHIADAEPFFFRAQLFFLLLLWSAQALVAGGTVFFKRSPILRSVLFYFLLGVVLIWVGPEPKTGVFWSPITDDVVPHSTLEYGFSLGQWAGPPLLLWVAVFFHLKEREVS